MWVDGLGEGQLTESGVVAAWGVVQLVGQVTGRSDLVLLGSGMGLLLWARKMGLILGWACSLQNGLALG